VAAVVDAVDVATVASWFAWRRGLSVCAAVLSGLAGSVLVPVRRRACRTVQRDQPRWHGFATAAVATVGESAGFGAATRIQALVPLMASGIGIRCWPTKAKDREL
jgi:hypothetical protein